ncbi:MAG: hypothetical protein ACR2G4_14290 [Pyrinomonadaceae bacterium]
MTTTKEKLKEAVGNLVNEGQDILLNELTKEQPSVAKKSGPKKGASKSNKEAEDKEVKETQKIPLHQAYQAWYSKSLPVVRQILPERYQEFVEQYKLDKRKDKEIDFLTYTISDYLIGVRVTRGWQKEEVVNAFSAFFSKFQHQLTILVSCLDRLDSVLSNIQGTLQAELFDDELSAAEELMKKGHLRAAGALAGVTLERHFATVAQNHGIKIGKKEPTISDFNDTFKNESIYDVPTWRFIQRLGDIRNLSAHFKNREPTKDEIDEMLKGVQKVLKTVF